MGDATQECLRRPAATHPTLLRRAPLSRGDKRFGRGRFFTIHYLPSTIHRFPPSAQKGAFALDLPTGTDYNKDVEVETMIKDSQLKVIKELEKQIGRELEEFPINAKGKTDRGFAVDKAGNVVLLNLASFNLSDISVLSGLTQLINLNLSDNDVSDISSLSGLAQLTTLSLRNTHVSDISVLSGLTQLTTLSLRNTHVSDMSVLSGLTQLTSLNLSNTELSDLNVLSGLTQLTSLNLSNTELSDLNVLSGLTQLTSLDLSYNKLSDISVLSGLTQLTTLNLASTNVSNLSFLSSLTQLTSLDLGYNRVSDISVLSGLTQLIFLELRRNTIKKLPPLILELDMGIDIKAQYRRIKHITLYGNPLESPPPEIIKKGKEAMRAYFESLETGDMLPLNEVKVLLVGDGGAGKTSLVKRLRGKGFDKNEPQTHGINIDQWNLQCGEANVTTRMWDFGGQEIMHSTHQFFLSKRSLYVLVLDGRKDEKMEYWLKHIQSFGGKSPVLVVLNKMDENPGFEVNRKYLKDKFPDIVDFYRVSCKKGEGIDAFSQALAGALDKVELLSTPWPESWFKVKTRLECMNKPFIDFNEYRALCEEEKVSDDKGMETLVEFLNDLGVVVHFEELHLQNIHVLKPKWVTEAVYKIINSKQLAAEKGILKLSRLAGILKQDKKGDYNYKPDKYPYIIQLMKKFELCYEIDMDTVLVPDLLEVQEPEFDFDYSDCLSFIFQYEFLPRSVMPRFIVRMHQDIQECCQWRTGMMLQSTTSQAEALVKAHHEEKRIAIYVNGKEKRDYFSVLHHTLQAINDSFKKLPVNKLVPLPGSKGVSVELSELMGHERAGKTEIFIGKLGKTFDVGSLLNGVSTIKERKEEYQRIPGDQRGGDVLIKNVVNPQQLVIQKVDQQTTVDVDVDIDIDINIKVELPAFVRGFRDLKDELEAEPGVEPLLKNRLKELEDQMAELDLKAGKKELKKPFNKMGLFLEKLADENSGFNKALKGTKRGIELAQKAAKTYNKFSQWLALPQVPEVFLGKKDKKP
jgi:small GTP-binding protein